MRIPILFTLLMKFHFRLLFLEVAMQKSSLALLISFNVFSNHLFNTQKVLPGDEKRKEQDDNCLKLGQCCAIDFLEKMKKSFYHFLLYAKFIFTIFLYASINFNVTKLYQARSLTCSLNCYLIFLPLDSKYLQTSLILRKRNFETKKCVCKRKKRFN